MEPAFQRHPVTWSEECYRILGYDPAQGLPSFESSLERIHPEDRPALAETMERAVREKAEFQIEYRVALPDGTRRNVRILSHPVLDAFGKLIEFVGTVMDVTEQKRATRSVARTCGSSRAWTGSTARCSEATTSSS